MSKKTITPKGINLLEKVQVPVAAVEQVIREEEAKVCGVDPANFKGSCQLGVSLNSELCQYNPTSKRCNKASKLTWPQIEQKLKSGSPLSKKEEKKVIEAAKEVAQQVQEEVAQEESQPKGRKLSPFFIFMAQMREQVKADNPDKSVKEIANILGNMWHALTPDEQAVYKDMDVKVQPKAPKVAQTCGYDVAKKNCVRGVSEHQEYCQEGEKGQCKKADKFAKYNLDEIARLIAGEEVAEKVRPVKPKKSDSACGFDVSKKKCVRGVGANEEYCQDGLKGLCKKASAYEDKSTEQIIAMINGEQPIKYYCRVSDNGKTCVDADEDEDDPDTCYYNIKTKKCTRRKVSQS
jgi:hypothetical protein